MCAAAGGSRLMASLFSSNLSFSPAHNETAAGAACACGRLYSCQKTDGLPPYRITRTRITLGRRRISSITLSPTWVPRSTMV